MIFFVDENIPVNIEKATSPTSEKSAHSSPCAPPTGRFPNSDPGYSAGIEMLVRQPDGAAYSLRRYPERKNATLLFIHRPADSKITSAPALKNWSGIWRRYCKVFFVFVNGHARSTKVGYPFVLLVVNDDRSASLRNHFHFFAGKVVGSGS